MGLSRKILFVFITVLCIGSKNINSQAINSSLACNGAKNCETCVLDSSCFWCETQLSCKVYDAKSKDEQTKACGEWSWKSCEEADASLIAIISGCASVALICGEYIFGLDQDRDSPLYATYFVSVDSWFVYNLWKYLLLSSVKSFFCDLKLR